MGASVSRAEAAFHDLGASDDAVERSRSRADVGAPSSERQSEPRGRDAGDARSVVPHAAGDGGDRERVEVVRSDGENARSRRGATTSGRSEVGGGELRRALRTLCEARSETPDAMDVFWYELGNASSEPLTQMSEKRLDEMLRPYGRALYANSARSGGLYKLARHAARQLTTASGNARTSPVSAINVAVLVGTFIKYFIEFGSEGEGSVHGVSALGGPRSERLRSLAKTFEYNERWETGIGASGASPAKSRSPFDDLLLACVDILCNKRVTSPTMALHLACVRLLLMACSSQLMFDLDDAEAKEVGHPLARRLFHIASNDAKLAGSLMCALLRQIVARPPNSGDICETGSDGVNLQAGGITRGVATAFSALFSMRSTKSSRQDEPSLMPRIMMRSAHSVPSPLGDECVHLFLALCSHSAFGTCDENPFRVAVKNLKDVASRSSVPANRRDSTLVDFEQLIVALRDSASTDTGLLTLYVLISTNSRFLRHVGTSASAASIAQELVKELYGAETSGLAHVSQLIVVMLLILSQDVNFSRSMQTHTCTSTNWYKERIVQKCSLGSMIFIVLTRALKYDCSNSEMVAKELQLLGTIANMACVTRAISGYAAQRLVDVLALFTRKRAKLLRLQSEKSKDDAFYCPISGIEVCEDFIRIMFEILNCLVTDLDSLEHNPEIVYALMHREEVLMTYRTHPDLAEYVQNIEGILRHYHNAVDSLQENKADSPMSVGRLKRVISENSLDISPSPKRLSTAGLNRDCSIHEFHPLSFTYVEDDTTTAYFLSVFIWACIARGGVLWRAPAFLATAAMVRESFHSVDSSWSEDTAQSDVV